MSLLLQKLRRSFSCLTSTWPALVRLEGGRVTIGCLLGRCMPRCIPAGMGASQLAAWADAVVRALPVLKAVSAETGGLIFHGWPASGSWRQAAPGSWQAGMWEAASLQGLGSLHVWRCIPPSSCRACM